MSELNKLAVNNSHRENKNSKGVSQYNCMSSTQQTDAQRIAKIQNASGPSANMKSLNRKHSNEGQKALMPKLVNQIQPQTQDQGSLTLTQNHNTSEEEAYAASRRDQDDSNFQMDRNLYKVPSNINQNQQMKQHLKQFQTQDKNYYSENQQNSSESGDNQANQEDYLQMNNQQQFLQNQMQLNAPHSELFQQLMGQNAIGNQNMDPNEFNEQWKIQQNYFLQQQPGNQLKQFAIQMFKSLSKLEIKKLHQKAKEYFEQQQKAENQQKKKQRVQNVKGQSEMTQDSDSEPHQTYLDNIQKAISKYPELQDNFMRFVQPQFEDESEQVFADFMQQNPLLHHYYMHLAHLYLYYQQIEDQNSQDLTGQEIFNKIMPYAQQTDPRLIQMIPTETLDLFRIEYESDGFIRSWEYIGDQPNSDDQDYTSSCHQSENSQQSLLDNSDVNENSSSNQNNYLQNRDIKSTEQSQLNSNEISEQRDSQDLSKNKRIHSNEEEGAEHDRKQKYNGLYGIAGNNIIPQSALTGKNKSLMIQFSAYHSNQKNLNKNEFKTFDNFFKSLREEKDWMSFCKIFMIYFSGVISLREFFTIYDSKFQSKVKQEIKDEIEKLLPTREQNRRAQSQLLNPWNDLDNQAFEKIPDSSYYRIEDEFPIPTCTGKMLNPIYQKNINDRYLSLATGSEKTENSKFAFKNNYEEKIFQHEDKLYEYDTLIDNFKKSYKRVNEIFDEFMQLSETEQNNYKFPVHRLNPLRLYWDSKFRKSMQENFLKDGKVLKEKDFIAFKKSLYDKHDFLENQKKNHLNEIKEQFKKNFTKSLDHKSFQYKQFITQFLQKKFHIQKLKILYEDNLQKKRILPQQISLLLGSGEIPENSNYRYFNTFGKDFNKVFDMKRLQKLQQQPDHPVDMKFMHLLPVDILHKYQGKCPQARFIMNDKRTFETTIKLVLQNIKLQNSNHHQSATLIQEKECQISSLKFILEKFMMVDNFHHIESQSENIQQLTPKLIDILMNSIQYYQMKYDGQLQTMEEVFPIDENSEIYTLQKQSEVKDNLIQDVENVLNLKNKQNADKSLSSQDSKNFNFSVKQNLLFEKMKYISHTNQKAYTTDIQNKISNFQSLNTEEKEELINNLEKQMEQSLFIPSFDQNLDKSDQKQEYKLMYGSLNIYMFMLYFYSIYERLLKAYDLVDAKVQQDFKDDFSLKDWSQKFETKIQKNIINERFQYLVKAIVSSLNLQNNAFDSGKYEDLARELLGNEAYLLFQIEKLIKACSMQLVHFQTDVYCKVSQKIFNEFEDSSIKKESAYISQFHQEASECHNQQLLNGLKQGQSQNQITGAAANNKDIHNPPITQTAFRLLYSPQSNILTAHYICFNPFGQTDNKSNRNAHSFSLSNEEIKNCGYLQFLMEYTSKENIILKEENSQNYETNLSQKQTNLQFKNKVSQQCQPIFLKRNLLQMKRLRKQKQPFVQENNMILQMIPQINQIQYEINKSDTIIYKREHFNICSVQASPDENENIQMRTTSQVSIGKLKGKKSMLGKRKAPTAQEDIQLQSLQSEGQIQPNFELKDLQKHLKFQNIMNERLGYLRQKHFEQLNRRQYLPQNFINQRMDQSQIDLEPEISLNLEQDEGNELLSEQMTESKNNMGANGSQILTQTINSSEQMKTRNSLGRQCKQSNEKLNSFLQGPSNIPQNNNIDKKAFKIAPLNTNRGKYS